MEAPKIQLDINRNKNFNEIGSCVYLEKNGTVKIVSNYWDGNKPPCALRDIPRKVECFPEYDDI